MSTSYISTALRRMVEERAKYRCEYCLLPNNISFFSHEIDHVIAEKHGGQTEENNLAYSCLYCNRYKGSDLGSFDPLTGDFSFLFNPRLQEWSEHFALENFQIIGLTPEGRTTAQLLQFNTKARIAERQQLEGS
jgi:hypothetical protein